MGRRIFLTGLALTSMACADPRPRTPRIDRPGDKQAVYGDPTLLPTREGERVRTYEMPFLPWSDALDRQLELALPEGPEDSEEPEDSDP